MWYIVESTIQYQTLFLDQKTKQNKKDKRQEQPKFQWDSNCVKEEKRKDRIW